jgi:hypothetical protein
MKIIINKGKRIHNYFYFTLLFLLLLFSCKSNDEYEFFVPSIPFEDGYEELGDNASSNLKYKFELFKFEYVLNLAIEKELFVRTCQLPKTISVQEGDQLSSQEYYDLFLHDDNDIIILNDILDQINNRAIGTDFDQVQVIVNFVQSIPYEEAINQKYPIETLYSNKGDCSDKSILPTKLLDLSGFDVCLCMKKQSIWQLE